MGASQPTSREIVRVLAALSDENRFRIVELLAERDDELSCGTIGDALDLSPSLLSHHLAILADAGIIGRRKNGLWTMNVLQQSVIARQLEVLESLIDRNGPRTNGAVPPAEGAAAPREGAHDDRTDSGPDSDTAALN